MRKILPVIILIFLFANTSSIIFAKSNNDKIVRRIITELKWNQEIPRIEVNYIYIKKKENTDFEVFNFVEEIYSDDFTDEPWSYEEMKAYLKKYHSYSIYHSDEIFGHKVKLFADLSANKNVSEEELQDYVNRAKRSIENAFVNPPNFKEGFDYKTLIVRVIFFVVGIFIVYLLIKNRYK